MQSNTVNDEASSKSGAYFDAVNYVAHYVFTMLRLYPLGKGPLPPRKGPFTL